MRQTICRNRNFSSASSRQIHGLSHNASAQAVKQADILVFDIPENLGLRKVLLNAGLSSQSVLLGRKEVTYEALYLSDKLQKMTHPVCQQKLLFEEVV